MPRMITYTHTSCSRKKLPSTWALVSLHTQPRWGFLERAKNPTVEWSQRLSDHLKASGFPRERFGSFPLPAGKLWQEPFCTCTSSLGQQRALQLHERPIIPALEPAAPSWFCCQKMWTPKQQSPSVPTTKFHWKPFPIPWELSASSKGVNGAWAVAKGNCGAPPHSRLPQAWPTLFTLHIPRRVENVCGRNCEGLTNTSHSSQPQSKVHLGILSYRQIAVNWQPDWVVPPGLNKSHTGEDHRTGALKASCEESSG